MVFERAEGILPVCSCVQRENRFFELCSSFRPNVSCDDTVLPARSSNWTPVTSPTRNPFAVTRCIGQSNLFDWSSADGQVGGDDLVPQEAVLSCEVRIDWRARP